MSEKGSLLVDKSEIVSSLARLNGVYFNIPDLDAYATKIEAHGKSVEHRIECTNRLASYVLYYDDGPSVFISMVWTDPKHEGRGFAKKLLMNLIRSQSKDIYLEVHKDNPAAYLYKSLGFVFNEQSGDTQSLCLRQRLAIMQPYVFPYLGYFHLIAASSLFVFYDDVTFTKGSWIARNRILLNGGDFLFSFPLSRASQNKLINEIALVDDDAWREKFRRTIIQAYKAAPYFSMVEPLISSIIFRRHSSVSDLAIDSIVAVFDYLGMPFDYTRSSVCSPETRGIGKIDRLVAISKKLGYKRYVNAMGGVDLYAKEDFAAEGVELSFIKSDVIKYEQYSEPFVPWLSIIDVLMFNAPETVKGLFAKYQLK